MFNRPVALAASLALLVPGAMAAAPLPAPTPATVLKVIANVRSTPRCAEIVTHANSAIGSALNDDLLIQQTITRLRAINLDDGNPIHRRNALNALGDLASLLTRQSRSADDEVKRLRALAAKTTDPQEKKALEEFANELGGALWRQQRIARDLNGLLAAVDFQQMATFSEAQRQANAMAFGVSDPLAEGPFDVQATTGQRSVGAPAKVNATQPALPRLGHDISAPNATQEAQSAATDFESRLPDITLDENDAAQHVSGALSGC